MSTSPEERLDAIVAAAKQVLAAKKARDVAGVIEAANSMTRHLAVLNSDWGDDVWYDRDPRARFEGW